MIQIKKQYFSFLCVFMVVFVFHANIQQARAEAWGSAMAAAVAKQAMEEAYTEIQSAILGTLKVAAYELLHTQVGQLVGGTSVKDSMIISDWEDFVRIQPEEDTAVYMNDFFSATFQGKNGCDYVPVNPTNTEDPFVDSTVTACGAIQEGVGFVQNFPSQIEEYARRTIGGAVAEGLDTAKEYTLDQFCDDPSNMFAQGNWKCFHAYFSNDYNNPYAYALQASKAYEEELEKKQQVAELKSVAYQGYKPQTTQSADGKEYVVTPGSLIKDIQSAVTDLGNKIIAAADSPAEFASALVTSFVTSYIQQTIRNGVGEIQNHIRGEIREIDSRVSGEINRVVDEIGPHARYLDLYQSDSEEWKKYYKDVTGNGSEGEEE